MTLKPSSRGCRPLVDAYTLCLTLFLQLLQHNLCQTLQYSGKPFQYFELNCNLQAVHASSVWYGEPIRMICSLKDSSPSKGNYFQFTSNLVIYEPKLTCLITNYLSSSELAVNCCNKHYLVSEMNLRTESYQGLGPCMLRSFVFLFKIENGTICVFFVKKKKHEITGYSVFTFRWNEMPLSTDRTSKDQMVPSSCRLQILCYRIRVLCCLLQLLHASPSHQTTRAAFPRSIVNLSTL